MSGHIIAGSILEAEYALEAEAVEEGVRRYYEQVQSAVARGDGASVKPAERLMIHWFSPVRREIVKEQGFIRQGRPAPHRSTYGPVIHLVDPSIIATIGIREVLSHCLAGDGEATVAKVAYAIGNAIIAHLHSEQLRRDPDRKEAFAKMVMRIRNMNPCKINQFVRMSMDEHYWSIRIATKVGVRVLWAVIEASVAGDYGDPKAKAAFLYRCGTKKSARVVMTQEAWDLIRDGHATRQFLRPEYLPMLCQPAEWQFDPKDGTLIEGGYYRIRTPLMSHPTRRQREAFAIHKPQTVLDGLNALCATRFRINRRVHAVERKLWDSGGGAANIPRANDFELPPTPSDFGTNEEATAGWKREATLIHEKNRKLVGVRTIFAKTLDLANRFADAESFCLPHQLCFRARTYPLPVYLNHSGGDVARGLFEFARSVPANTPDAQRWLRIHAANCAGIDKATFEDRLKWVKDHESEIERVASDPLRHDSWMRAKKPFQFLAACYALCDPKDAAHLPVQRDGTCNGLQHLAALGRDEIAGRAVNLIDSDVVGDAYGLVGEKTRDKLAADSARGVHDATIILAHLNRDLVKLPVMTKLYNVTEYGASRQLMAKMKAMGFESKRDQFHSARYFARIVLAAAAEAYPAAMSLMEYFSGAAHACVTKYPTRPFAWKSPIGMPVVQDGPKYTRQRKIRIPASDIKLIFPMETTGCPVRIGKQKNGAPPNIIHSIDGAHKFLTAIECRANDIDFADNHDNYWSHAAHAVQSDRINRSNFVITHSPDIVAQLDAEWRREFPNAELPPIPPKGTLSVSSVLTSRYFFH
jgi:DNA-directed RNA polymerase